MPAAVAFVVLGTEMVLLAASLYAGGLARPRATGAPVLLGEAGLLAIGLALQWRFLLRPRTPRPPVLLARWEAPPFEFLFFLFCVLSGGFLAGLPVVAFEKFHPLEGVAKIVVYNTASQFGLLGGALVFRLLAAKKSAEPVVGPRPNFLLAGVITFFISLPLLGTTAIAWGALLRSVGVPHLPQELIGIFRETKSFVLSAALAMLAVVIAPMTEEVIFRGGIFRWLRTRLSRPAALVLPGLVFAALHVSWSTTLAGLDSFLPLIVLAVLYSLAYERTGHLGTTMVAHALFNLHTVLLLLVGLDV